MASQPISPQNSALPQDVAASRPAFEPPFAFGGADRRLAGRVTDAWVSGDTSLIALFETRTVTIAIDHEPPIVRRAGHAVSRDFGLMAGQHLDDAAAVAGGLAGRLAKACNTIRITGRPTPFEADVLNHKGACLLARGVLLPAAEGEVRAVLSWREELSAKASAALRRELLAASRSVRG